MDLTKLLYDAYGIYADRVVPAPGGWSSAAYRVETAGGRYFLKVYDDLRETAQPWVRRMIARLPLLVWLQGTPLGPHIPRTHPALDGRHYVPPAVEGAGTCMLFDWIDGRTVGDDPYPPAQLVELARLLATLHSYNASDIPSWADALAEDTVLPFCDALQSLLDGDLSPLPAPLAPLVEAHADTLTRAVPRLRTLLQTARLRVAAPVLCHTDAHGYNVLQSDRLMLIDWEGVCLAPPEADLFMFAGRDDFGGFLHAYRQVRPGYTPDEALLSFYRLRRRLEDIWEFIAQLLYDRPDEATRADALRHLQNELMQTALLLGP